MLNCSVPPPVNEMPILRVASGSTKAPPNVTVPAPAKVSVEVPIAEFVTVWLTAVPAVLRLTSDLLVPLRSRVALLPTLPRTRLVELDQAEALPRTSLPERT